MVAPTALATAACAGHSTSEMPGSESGTRKAPPPTASIGTAACTDRRASLGRTGPRNPRTRDGCVDDHDRCAARWRWRRGRANHGAAREESLGQGDPVAEHSHRSTADLCRVPPCLRTEGTPTRPHGHAAPKRKRAWPGSPSSISASSPGATSIGTRHVPIAISFPGGPRTALPAAGRVSLTVQPA